jgi:hypothetical protein
LQDQRDINELRTPNPRLSNARHMGDYQMWLQFADGRTGIVDFSDDLWGDDLEPLRDPGTFTRHALVGTWRHRYFAVLPVFETGIGSIAPARY